MVEVGLAEVVILSHLVVSQDAHADQQNTCVGHWSLDLQIRLLDHNEDQVNQQNGDYNECTGLFFSQEELEVGQDQSQAGQQKVMILVQLFLFEVVFELAEVVGFLVEHDQVAEQHQQNKDSDKNACPVVAVEEMNVQRNR